MRAIPALLILCLAWGCGVGGTLERPPGEDPTPGSRPGEDGGSDDTSGSDDTGGTEGTGGTVDPCADHSTGVVINELVASNVRGLVLEDGDTPDWIELANLGVETVDLDGWGLSDDLDQPDKWVLPSVELAPGGFLLVYASGRDRDDDPADLHTSFSLSAEDEPVVLSWPDGCPADVAEPDRLYRDISYGRTAEDPQVWGYFQDSTPGEDNHTESRPGFAEVPLLSPEPGFHAEPISVTATSTEPGAMLRYTLGGGAPDDHSRRYTGALRLESTDALSVVRVRAYVDGLWPSRVATATYATNTAILDDGLDVISLVVDPFDLYDHETGIYAYGPADYTPTYPYFGANFWEDWERDLHIEVWDADGTLVVDQAAGIKIHGGYTRAFEQKSFRVIARSGYGPSSIEHAFFDKDPELDSFKNIVLEGVGDWCPTHTENAFVQELFRDHQDKRFATIDTQAWEPAVLYLNGQLWGLYSFREKLDEHWIEAHHDADPDNLDRVECTADGSDDWWRVSQGDWDAFHALNTFVATHDLAEDEAWAEFKTMVDIDNLATTVLAEGYGANTDWWNNNLKLWRPRDDDGRWRWMVFDIGHSWRAANTDHLETSVSWTGPGLPIQAALRNDELRFLLANQGSDFLNTNLETEHALAVLDDMHARIQPVIAEQYALWCGEDEAYWNRQVAGARTFVQGRAYAMWRDLQDHLDLDGTVDLTLEAVPPGSGTFQLTVVEVTPPFTGRFWMGIPVSITAVPAEGWSFSGWTDESLGTEPALELVLDEGGTLTATFE